MLSIWTSSPSTDPERRELWRGVDARYRDAVMRTIREAAPTHIAHLASDIDVSILHLYEFCTTIYGTRNVLAAAESTSCLARYSYVLMQYVVRPRILLKTETEFVQNWEGAEPIDSFSVLTRCAINATYGGYNL